MKQSALGGNPKLTFSIQLLDGAMLQYSGLSKIQVMHHYSTEH